MLEKQPAQIILANTVNELMLTVPVLSHSSSLSSASTRKIWLANEEDIIITNKPISQTFKSYVCSLLGLNSQLITNLSLSCSETVFLADILHRSNYLKKLHHFREQHNLTNLLCYALDQSTWKISQELNILPKYYDRPIPFSLIKKIYDLNLKSSFRRIAANLGLQTVVGNSCKGLSSLIESVTDLLVKYDKLIIKLDRSSNGYGHFIITRKSHIKSLETYLKSYIYSYKEQPQEFIVEVFMPFISVPSIEMIIDSSGINPYYICDQRCRNHSFSGMTTPPIKLLGQSKQKLLEAGYSFGEYLYNIGYRGVFDIDAGITEDGNLFFTETNLRRTGGTYLHELVCRLIGNNYCQNRIWLSDARNALPGASFEKGYSAIESAKLAFRSATTKGVIFTADTLADDLKWRYLILAEDENEASFLENQLAQVLKFQM